MTAASSSSTSSSSSSSSSSPAAASADASAGTVSRRTRWMVYGVVGILTAGHLGDMALRREHWPFSNYPMWSVASTKWLASDVRLRGVPADGGPEVQLVPKQFGPLPGLQLYRGLSTTSPLSEADLKAGKPDRLKKQMVDLLKLYETRRAAGQHDGPALSTMRLYRLEWEVHPTDADRVTPDVSTILSEVHAGDAAPSANTAAAAAR